jgi:phospho-N-acetylmuramoyl-pentapeptide-transferase
MQPTSGQEILFFCFAISAGLTAGILWILARSRTQGSVIREQGPQHHKAKASTPSTGGYAFLTSLALVGFPGAILIGDPRAIVGVLSGLLTGFIGLADDVIKVTKKDSSGLKARYKLPLQIFVGLLVTGSCYYMMRDDTIRIPFMHVQVHLGLWKIVFGLFVYLTIVNAVNFTDGIDGLAAGTVFIAALYLGGTLYTARLWLEDKPSAVVPVILMGICSGFLPFNWNPAQIFMGDSGALCLGGALAAVAMASGLEISILIIGLVFIMEIATVVMQVVYFRITHGKKLFRMTPIHHAWELRGYREPAIVIAFVIVGILAGTLGWWSA